jgi:hypothetical protein
MPVGYHLVDQHMHFGILRRIRERERRTVFEEIMAINFHI